MKNEAPLFSPFESVFEVLDDLMPEAIALVGSRGDPSKCPDEFSDIDAIFVFEGTSVLSVLKLALQKFGTIAKLESAYLGVHFQFGHVISVFFRDEPLRWFDIGIMDRHFSRNYLVNLSFSVVRGRIESCGLPQNPRSQMQHLARKLKKALLRDDQLHAVSCAYRYLSWLQVLERSDAPSRSHDLAGYLLRPPHLDSSRIPDRATDGLHLKDALPVVQSVLHDIKGRFPELAAAA